MGSHELFELVIQNHLIISLHCFLVSKRSFLYQLVIDDEKWIYYDPKHKKS